MWGEQPVVSNGQSVFTTTHFRVQILHGIRGKGFHFKTRQCISLSDDLGQSRSCDIGRWYVHIVCQPNFLYNCIPPAWWFLYTHIELLHEIAAILTQWGPDKMILQTTFQMHFFNQNTIIISEVERGIYIGFALSVCLFVDGIVSALYSSTILAGSISFLHILSTKFRRYVLCWFF